MSKNVNIINPDNLLFQSNIWYPPPLKSILNPCQHTADGERLPVAPTDLRLRQLAPKFFAALGRSAVPPELKSWVGHPTKYGCMLTTPSVRNTHSHRSYIDLPIDYQSLSRLGRNHHSILPRSRRAPHTRRGWSYL